VKKARSCYAAIVCARAIIIKIASERVSVSTSWIRRVRYYVKIEHWCTCYFRTRMSIGGCEEIVRIMREGTT